MAPTAAAEIVAAPDQPEFAHAFAVRLRRAREERRLTQRELAFAAGTGQSHVIKLEERAGKQKVLITSLWKLSAALEVPVPWLTFGGGPVPGRVAVHYDERRVRTAFYRRAKFARVARGVSQKEMGVLLGIAQGNVSAIERGVQGASLTSLHGYRDALALSPEWLMDTSEEIPWPF